VLPACLPASALVSLDQPFSALPALFCFAERRLPSVHQSSQPPDQPGSTAAGYLMILITKFPQDLVFSAGLCTL